MLQHRIIPSLLLKEGRLVKGVSFNEHRDAGNPATTVRAYSAQKADEILLLDIEANRRGYGPDLSAVQAVAAECSIPLSVGGGITSTDIAKSCLDSGADKICLNTAALDRPELITECARQFGSQAVTVAIDIAFRDGKPAIFDNRTGTCAPARDWLDWTEEADLRGAGEFRLMDVDREGRRSGYNYDLLMQARSRTNLPVIVEGGAGDLKDLAAAMDNGCEALALGTMLVFSDNNIIQVKRFLKNAGFPIRL